MAELANGGTSSGEVTSFASVRPKDASRSTSSDPDGRAVRSTSSIAWSMVTCIFTPVSQRSDGRLRGVLQATEPASHALPTRAAGVVGRSRPLPPGRPSAPETSAVSAVYATL